MHILLHAQVDILLHQNHINNLPHYVDHSRGPTVQDGCSQVAWMKSVYKHPAKHCHPHPPGSFPESCHSLQTAALLLLAVINNYLLIKNVKNLPILDLGTTSVLI